MSEYERTIAWLQQLEVAGGWDLKLERMATALALRGHPERTFPALHVAGTNGKGSTAAMAEAVLRAAGYRTGLYTSPHLVDFAERIRAGGGTIPRPVVVDRVAELRRALARADIALTHFEFATLLAFEWFAHVGIDVAVVEVGLGGRLDATTLVHPLVVAITSVARDHEEFLGADLASIAAEKAGVLKPGVPAVLGALPAVAADAVRRRAREVGSRLYRAGRDYVLDGAVGSLAFRGPHGVGWDGIHLGLPGRFQRANAEVALAVVALVQERFPCPPDAVRAGLATVSWPGRLELVEEEPRLVVDGAHNAAGMATLVAELPAVLGGRHAVLVFAATADKPWRDMLGALLPFVRWVVVTAVGRRAVPPAALATAVPAALGGEIHPTPRAALRAAATRAGRTGVVLVAGSIFLAGAFHAIRGRPLFESWRGWEAGGTDSAR